MIRMMLPVAMSAILLVAGMQGAAAQGVEEQARAIFEANRAAVVTVQLVVKQKFSMMGMGGEEEESKVEATGTVIDPEGLTVLALSSTDPTSVITQMMGGMGEDFQMDSQVSDVKILRGDNTEVPARIVLRDKDLDLAYVRPIEKPAASMPFVDLKNAATADILQQLVAVNRLGRVANRTHSVALERVEAVVSKPRTFYVPAKDPTNTSQGAPAFTLDGNVVGIFVLRAIRDTGGGMGGMFGMDDNVAGIILPAADILEGAAQAPGFGEAVAEEPAEVTVDIAPAGDVSADEVEAVEE